MAVQHLGEVGLVAVVAQQDVRGRLQNGDFEAVLMAGRP
jgi:hypothetical protein